MALAGGGAGAAGSTSVMIRFGQRSAAARQATLDPPPASVSHNAMPGSGAALCSSAMSQKAPGWSNVMIMEAVSTVAWYPEGVSGDRAAGDGSRRLFLIDSTPVGDRLLDPMLAEIAQAEQTHDALYWVDHATRHADEIRETALARLVGNGILDVSDDRFLRIFGTRHYALANDGVEGELIRRIKAVLLTDAIPDPRDIVIVTLADGCGLIGQILSADELAGAAARIELVRNMDLIGRVFLNAVDVAVQPAADKLDRGRAASPPPTGSGNR